MRSSSGKGTVWNHMGTVYDPLYRFCSYSNRLVSERYTSSSVMELSSQIGTPLCSFERMDEAL